MLSWAMNLGFAGGGTPGGASTPDLAITSPTDAYDDMVQEGTSFVKTATDFIRRYGILLLLFWR